MPKETVKELYENALQSAKARSLLPDWKGCGVHVCAKLGRVDGVPAVTGFTLSDWWGEETVATFANGEQR